MEELISSMIALCIVLVATGASEALFQQFVPVKIQIAILSLINTLTGDVAITMPPCGSGFVENIVSNVGGYLYTPVSCSERARLFYTGLQKLRVFLGIGFGAVTGISDVRGYIKQRILNSITCSPSGTSRPQSSRQITDDVRLRAEYNKIMNSRGGLKRKSRINKRKFKNHKKSKKVRRKTRKNKRAY